MAVLRRTASQLTVFCGSRSYPPQADGGYTHRQAVLLLYLWSFVIGYGAVLLTYFPEIVISVVVLAMALLVLLTLRP